MSVHLNASALVKSKNSSILQQYQSTSQTIQILEQQQSYLYVHSQPHTQLKRDVVKTGKQLVPMEIW